MRMYATKKRQKATSVTTKKSSLDLQLSSTGNPSKRHRERLNAELECLASLLPFHPNVISKLDKLSVLRLAVSFLEVKTHFTMCIHSQIWPFYSLYPLPGVSPDRSDSIEDATFKTLGGFVIMICENSEVFYVSPNVEKFLGFHQSDILHQPVHDLIHSEDRQELCRQLQYVWEGGAQPQQPPSFLSQSYIPPTAILKQTERSFVARFRCLLDNTCGFVRLEIHGHICVLLGMPQCYIASRANPKVPVLGLVAVCTPLVAPLATEPQEPLPTLFKTKHNLDLSFVSTDARAKEILNLPDSISSISFYSFVLPDDLDVVATAHREAAKTGASGLLAFRILQRETERLLYFQSSIRLFYKNGKPETISCTHRLLTELEAVSLLSKRKSSLSLALSFEDSLNPAKFPLAQSVVGNCASGPSPSRLRTKRYRTSNSANSGAGTPVVAAWNSQNKIQAVLPEEQSCAMTSTVVYSEMTSTMQSIPYFPYQSWCCNESTGVFDFRSQKALSQSADPSRSYLSSEAHGASTGEYVYPPLCHPSAVHVVDSGSLESHRQSTWLFLSPGCSEESEGQSGKSAVYMESLPVQVNFSGVGTNQGSLGEGLSSTFPCPLVMSKEKGESDFTAMSQITEALIQH